MSFFLSRLDTYSFHLLFIELTATLSEPQEAMNCETPESDVNKQPAKHISPGSNRRVIFPRYHSMRTNDGDSKKKEEKDAVHDESPRTLVSPLTREGMDAVASSFQFRSPETSLLSATRRRRCDELGLDMPDTSSLETRRASFETRRIGPPTSSASEQSNKTRTSDKETKSLDPLASSSFPLPSSSFPLQSPGLRPKAPPRMCDELGIDIPAMSLDDNASNFPRTKPVLAPKAKAVNGKHFVKARPTPGNGGKPSPQRRSRIDASSKQYVTSQSKRPRAPVRKSSSLPTSPSSTEARDPMMPTNPSILRQGKWGSKPSSSLENKCTSVPSLVPLGDGSNSSSETLHSEHSTSTSEACASPNLPPLVRSVSFDARVWVMEYERSKEEIENTWFTPEELEQFRKQTIARLVAHNTELLPSGTGFVVQRGSIPSKAVFALPSMSAIAEDDDDEENEVDERDVVRAVNDEIRNVLVVDPHDICAKLFTRDLRRMLPEVNVCTASTSQEARKRVSNTRFDIVIVEERLKLFHRQNAQQWSPAQGYASGSEFIHVLQKESERRSAQDRCIFIAVSAHLEKDKERMQANGADFIWAKPPPKMDEIVRDILLKALLVKREKKEVADRLFGDVMGAA